MSVEHENCGECGVPDDICNIHYECVADVWEAAKDAAVKKFTSISEQNVQIQQLKTEITAIADEMDKWGSLKGCVIRINPVVFKDLAKRLRRI